MNGLVLNKPGFCFNRITDFVCFMWMDESQIFDGIDVYEYTESDDYGKISNIIILSLQ